jgi:RimJ/RimL family protein N-acetyltransferase
MSLVEQRRAIRSLLGDGAADAVADYYAFHHPDERTGLIPYPEGADRATAYLALSRTGIDLFRPFVTLRLPIADLDSSAEVIYHVLPPGTAVILFAPFHYGPLLRALFEVQNEETLHLYTLAPARFEPIINVLVTQTTGPNGLPRFIARASTGGEVIAAAGLNWQSPRYAELSVNTDLNHRRQGLGQSVVAAMVQQVLANGRSPIYLVGENNQPSRQLAESVGFRDSGSRKLLLQGSLRPRP